jgi:hypothetical protein
MRTHPWVRECVAYWSEIVYEGDIGVDWADADERCWRCGSKSKLQKCHIVARQFGGGDGPSNIIPLCSLCHDEMPDVTDPDAVWVWIKRTRPKYGYGTLWIEKALDECVSVGTDLSRFDKASFAVLMNKSVGLHMMQSGAGCRIKPASVAWAIQKSCKQEPTDAH